MVFGLSIAQNAEIPDTAFLYALIDEGVDTNGDSLISYSEAEPVISLNVNGRGISNMAGIEAFVNLDTLNCKLSYFMSLDLTGNPGLKFLDCQGILPNGSSLTSLNISNNTALTELICHYNHLTSLDVSGCIALDNLKCYNNQLTSLDLCYNDSIRTLVLGNMPTLDTVFVWSSFPDSVGLGTTGSPNVVFIKCAATGLAEYNKDECYFYPNPTNDLLTIETNQPGQHFIEITSLNG